MQGSLVCGKSQEQAGLQAVPAMSQRLPSLKQGWTEEQRH